MIKLEERHILPLFHPKHRKADIWDVFWALVKSVIGFAALFIFFFSIINFPAYSMKIGYFWKTVILGKEIIDSADKPLQLLNPVANSQAISSPNPLAPNGQSLGDFLKEHIKNDYLVVPSIAVNTPIVWDSPPNRILEDLKNGVAHYKGTAKPGENGNVFISGHSSNYWWDSGRYKQVFALLDKMKTGDRIYTRYNSQPYVYQVENIKIVKPSAIEVLNPSDHSIITLMTCTPVGTTLNRLVVQARQIYPAQNEGSPKTPGTLPDKLPSIR